VYLSELEKVENRIEKLQEEIVRIENVVNMVERALETIKNNKHYDIIVMKYLGRINMEQWENLVKMVKEFYKVFGQEEFLEKEMTIERMELREKLFDEEMNEYLEAARNNNRLEMLDAVVDMYYIHIGTLLEKYKGDIEKVTKIIFLNDDENIEYIWKLETGNGFNDITVEAFEEVHRSNMSKLQDGKAIFREDGKILKGTNYFRPNLKQFIDRLER
jgi:predicted HAD superfamily Cof-like phosphohydrolase